MLEDEEFAMRTHIFALLAAAALAVAETPAEARPRGGGWSAGHAGAGWGGPRFHGRRGGFKGGALAAPWIGSSGGRYLSDDAWFLSDIGGYLADDRAYPDLWPGSDSDAYPVYSAPVSHGYRRSVSYAVPVHGSRHARRVVTVHRGVPGRAIRHLGR